MTDVEHIINTEEKLERLLSAITNNLKLWRLRQAPVGEDNENRDQEEADSVVDTLEGILRAAGIDPTRGS